jgi:hypothetical protein
MARETYFGVTVAIGAVKLNPFVAGVAVVAVDRELPRASGIEHRAYGGGPIEISDTIGVSVLPRGMSAESDQGIAGNVVGQRAEVGHTVAAVGISYIVPLQGTEVHAVRIALLFNGLRVFATECDVRRVVIRVVEVVLTHPVTAYTELFFFFCH